MWVCFILHQSKLFLKGNRYIIIMENVKFMLIIMFILMVEA